jgi:integrase
MGRPRTPVGTYGNINTTQLGPKRWRAEGRFRHADGRLVRAERTRASETAARNAVKEAFAEIAERIADATVSPDTTFERVADLWMGELGQLRAEGDVAANTIRNYKTYLRKWILPYCGELTMVELTVKALDDILTRVRTQRSKETTAGVKKVLRGVCGYAVRHGALRVNLATQLSRIRRDKDRKPVTGLTLEERLGLRARVREYCEARTKTKDGRDLGKRAVPWRGLPDMLDAMLSTGVRIGEVLAIAEEEVTIGDDGALLVLVDHHLVRDPEAGGLIRVQGRKGGRPALLLGVPSWSVSMWTSRAHAAHTVARETGVRPAPLWPSARGGWQDPDNVRTRLREALGADKVASHRLRHTVTQILDGADLPVTAMADQLGNTPAVVERHYRGRRASNADAVAALEAMWGHEVTPDQSGG